MATTTAKQGNDVATTLEVVGIAVLRAANGKRTQLKLIDTTTAPESNGVVLNRVFPESTPSSQSLEIFDIDGDAIEVDSFAGIGIGYFIRYNGKVFRCTEPQLMPRPPKSPRLCLVVTSKELIRAVL